MNDKTNPQANPEPLDENHIIAERREKLAKLREAGVPFPNDFVPTHLSADLHAHYDSLTKEELAAKKVHVKVAGRMVLKRVMGKASFATIQDRSGQIQFYISDEISGADTHASFSTGIWATLLLQKVIFSRPIKVSFQLRVAICVYSANPCALCQINSMDYLI